MSSSKREPCDFCGERTAVVFCKADTAKLCLPCDQQVHAANPLSRKHVRSQICDNCCKEPVSIRCDTENLILCQECDWDVHGSCSISVAHVRSAVDGFSGCPSAWELAALWRIDLEERKEKNDVQLMMENFGMELDSWISGSNVAQELTVPNDVPFMKHGSTCGKYKHVMYKQLEELLKRVDISGDVERDCNSDCDGGGDGGVGGCGDGVGGEEDIMVPEMPDRLGCSRDLEEINGGTEAIQNSPTTSFTSLLMYPTEYEGGSGDGMQRNAAHPSGGQSSQIWDFHLGQSRGPEDPTRMEAAYVTKGAISWRIENFVDLMNETCSTYSKGVKAIHQDDYNRSSSGQGPATPENNNHPGSKKGTNCSSDLQFSEDFAGTSCKTTRLVATKADLEQLAQNRGNAMQRYKEKRKSRRFDKTIRYESRKARAETRLRVKGRFVKASEGSYP